MASSPPQRLILSPTLVCVKLWSVVAIHLIHLALDLAGAASCRHIVCDTHPPGAGPRASGTRSAWGGCMGISLPLSSGPCSREEAGNQPPLHSTPTTHPHTPSSQQCLHLYRGSPMET